jgi:hypothetical protein
MIVFASDGAFASLGDNEALSGEPPSPKLPSPDIKRWTARRKAAVVIAVSEGRLRREETCRRYQLSLEELFAWEDAFRTYGDSGLYVGRLQQYRRPPLEVRAGAASARRPSTAETGKVRLKISCPARVK